MIMFMCPVSLTTRNYLGCYQRVAYQFKVLWIEVELGNSQFLPSDIDEISLLESRESSVQPLRILLCCEINS